MAIATFNNAVLQVHKATNRQKETVHYFAKLFPFQKSLKEFTFEYISGMLELREGDATDREKEMLIHSIQALELSDAFHE